MTSSKGRLPSEVRARNRFMLLIYAVIAIVFIVGVLSNQRGYQDSWILQDIFAPTILYILAFSVIATLLDNNKLVALVCASFLAVINGIPNLKYELILGTFDSVSHYGYITDLISLGRIPSTGFYAPQYQDFPGMHILVSSISEVSGLSVNMAIKLFASIIVGIIPLMTYFATNRAFKPDVQRFVILASGLPVFLTYYLSGSSFAIPLCFCIICLILRSLVAKYERGYAIVSLVLVFGLVFSHAITSLYLILFLVGALIISRFLGIRKNWILESYRNARSTVTVNLLLLIVLFAARLMSGSGNVLVTFTTAAYAALTGYGGGIVPSTFFRVPFDAQVAFFALTNVMYAVILLMSFMGSIVFIVGFRHKNRETYERFYPFLLCVLCAILALLGFQFVLNFAEPGYRRFIDYSIVLSPFLVGLLLWKVNHYFDRRKLGSAIVVLVLFSCISVSLIQIFPFQPMAPTANALSPGLPANEYVYDFRSVNTIYQKTMIFFAQNSSSNGTIIASDTVTYWQIHGFANNAFNDRTIPFSPLEYNPYRPQGLAWDLFLLHYDGKAGPLNEKVENRTAGRLNNLKEILGSVVYDNSGSFIIAR